MSPVRKDGGAAFPTLPPVDPTTGYLIRGYPFPDNGMTLLDYFAAKAMQSAFSDQTYTGSIEDAAKFAYNAAEAMVKEKQRRG